MYVSFGWSTKLGFASLTDFSYCKACAVGLMVLIYNFLMPKLLSTFDMIVEL